MKYVALIFCEPILNNKIYHIFICFSSDLIIFILTIYPAYNLYIPKRFILTQIEAQFKPTICKFYELFYRAEIGLSPINSFLTFLSFGFSFDLLPSSTIDFLYVIYVMFSYKITPCWCLMVEIIFRSESTSLKDLYNFIV